jgi:deferrochelatase/peroxidase EfeB
VIKTPTRRDFLTGAAAVAAGGVGLAAFKDGSARAAGPQASSTADRSIQFEGTHQQGILTPAQSAAALVALDVTTESRAELIELLHTITDQARFLTAGGDPIDLGLGAPPYDDGIVGPVIPADGLTVTLSVGASLFDDRFGLASAKPAKLTTMSSAPFPNDALQSSVCDGDLMLQLCADHSDTVIHALRQITKVTRGAMQIRWRQDGFKSLPRPTGHPRNLLGFKDGIANPDTSSSAEMDSLVWTDGGSNGEPAWTTGGTYHVVRVIRMLIEFWDRVNLREQEQMIGRRKDTGAPGTGGDEFTAPDYLKDPTGEAILFSAHIRKANPRVAATSDSRILRRGYNYDSGIDVNGQLQQGLVFVAFNQDLERQFKAVQTRLIDEPLVDYISPIGGGYYFALPGVTDSSDWFGRALLA